jgi:hypothetical protein
MSGHHEKCQANEVWVGNTERGKGRLEFFKGKGLKTVRLGSVALDIYGKPLEANWAPIFIHRSEEDAHNTIMMEETFGPNWRRG